VVRFQEQGASKLEPGVEARNQKPESAGTTSWDLRSQEPAAMSQEDGENDVRIRELGRNGKDSELQVTVRQEPCRSQERKKIKT
jgi:hypothetical protein